MISNSLAYGVGDLLQKFLSIFLLPIYTRYLAPEDYGIIALLGILTMIISTITMCGLTNGISRYFYYTNKENISRDDVIWSPLVFISLFTLIIISVIAIFSRSLSQALFDKPDLYYLIYLTLLNIFISNISGVGRAVLIFEEKVWRVNVISIAGVVFGVITGITMVVFLGRGVKGSVEASTITSLFIGLTTYFLSLKRYAFSFNYGILKKQLRFSLPLVGAIFAFFFIDSSDRYLLKIFLPVSEVGLYSIGYQMGLLMMVFVGGFTSAWPPYYHKNNQNNEGQSICNDVLIIYMIGASFLAVSISLLSPFIFTIFTTKEFHSAYTIVPFVALAYMLKGPYIIFLMGIIIKNKTSWQLYLEGFAAVINIILNIILIPLIGREAAAMTTLLSYFIMVFGSYYLVSIINPIPGSVIKPLLILLITSLFCVLPMMPIYKLNFFVLGFTSFISFTILVLLLFRNDFRAIKNNLENNL